MSDERPPSVLFTQYALIAQGAFDLFAGVGSGVYYGWAMTLAAQATGQSWMIGAAGGLVPALIGALLAIASAAAAWALSTRHPAAWISAIAVAAMHLIANPCCAPLPLLLLILLLRQDLRDWLD